MVGNCLFSRDGDTFTCSRCGYSISQVTTPLFRRCDAARLDPKILPGTELHAFLRNWLGIEPTPDCPCRSMAAKMDRLGPDWCESDEGMTEILGVMRTEHEKRRAEGTTILPWTDFGARQLVLLACRQARAKAAG